MHTVRLGLIHTNKIFAVYILKAVADDKLKVAHKKTSIPDRVENIVEKGENAGYNVFKGFVWKRVKQ